MAGRSNGGFIDGGDGDQEAVVITAPKCAGNKYQHGLLPEPRPQIGYKTRIQDATRRGMLPLSRSTYRSIPLD